MNPQLSKFMQKYLDVTVGHILRCGTECHHTVDDLLKEASQSA
jgi:hypothetical protein